MTPEEKLSDYVEMLRHFPPNNGATFANGFVVRSAEDLPSEFPLAIIRRMALAARRTRGRGWLDVSPMSAHKGERVDVWMSRCVAVLESWLASGHAVVPVLPRCPHCTPDAPCDRPRRGRSRR